MKKITLNIESDIYEYLEKYARDNNKTVTQVIHDELDEFTGKLASNETADIVSKLINK